MMGVIDDVKEVGDLIKKYNDIDLNRKIVKLEGEVLDLTRDKRRLESKVEELTAIVQLKQKLLFKPPFWWLEGDETPYCPSCWEGERKSIHVILQFDNEERTRWDCPSCKQHYLIEKDGSQHLAARHTPSGGGGPNSWMR
jgi:hypothetical protein